MDRAPPLITVSKHIEHVTTSSPSPASFSDSPSPIRSCPNRRYPSTRQQEHEETRNRRKPTPLRTLALGPGNISISTSDSRKQEGRKPERVALRSRGLLSAGWGNGKATLAALTHHTSIYATATTAVDILLAASHVRHTWHCSVYA